MTVRDIPDPAATGWHLDKRVPIALILTILFQGAALIVWGARIDARVTQLESKAIAEVDQPSRIVRLETKMEGMQDSLKDANGKLDRLLAK